jgi:hypothetical protein
MLTNSMELSTTREIPSCLDTRYFPSILCDPKVQFRIHKSSPYSEPDQARGKEATRKTKT